MDTAPVIVNPPKSAEERQHEEKLKAARRELVHLINSKIVVRFPPPLLHLLNFIICYLTKNVQSTILQDEKHIHLDKILDTTNFLLKIFSNVHDNPTEEKYRRIRLNNNAFNLHVRNAPGAEEFMLVGGWKASVVDFERYFVFEHQPGTIEWEILEIAVAELVKLKALLEGKLRRGDSGDRKAQKQKELEAVRHALEEDRQNRQLKYAAAGGS